jgi:predicted nucleic acid-binding protein
MVGSVFVDTWGWLALGHRLDPRHHEIKALYQSLRRQNRQVYTSDYVFDELITLLYRREEFEEATDFMEGIFSAGQSGHVVIERVTSARFAAAWSLRRRFQDKPNLSFTDLTSFSIMQERQIVNVLTEDEHFRQVGLGFQLVP